MSARRRAAIGAFVTGALLFGMGGICGHTWWSTGAAASIELVLAIAWAAVGAAFVFNGFQHLAIERNDRETAAHYAQVEADLERWMSGGHK